MKMNYLFNNKYKKYGWFILVPSIILGFLSTIFEYEPKFLDFNLPSIFTYSKNIFTSTNNILNEILGTLTIIGGILVAFSKEKLEDEYISKLRLESLVWSVYVNYTVLLISLLFIYDFAFFWVMIFNMFTILIFFILLFNWRVLKLKKTVNYEE